MGKVARWSSRKAAELANLATPTLAEVIDQAHKGIERVRRTPHLAYSFLRHAGLLIPAPCRPVGHMTLNPTPKSLPWVADGRPTSACGRTG
jgi:hypothetical protein